MLRLSLRNPMLRPRHAHVVASQRGIAMRYRRPVGFVRQAVAESQEEAVSLPAEQVLVLGPVRPFYRTPFFRAFVRAFVTTLLSVVLSALLAFALGYGLYVWMGKSTFQTADVASSTPVPAQPVLLAPTDAFGSQQKLVELPPAAAAAHPPARTADQTADAAAQQDERHQDE